MSKPTIYGYKPLNAVDASVNQTSEATVVGQLDKLTYQCKFSAPCSGTFVVEAKSEDTNRAGTWYSLDFGGAMTISSETDVVMNLDSLPFSHLRIKWVPDVSQTGTLTVQIAAKTVGA